MHQPFLWRPGTYIEEGKRSVETLHRNFSSNDQKENPFAINIYFEPRNEDWIWNCFLRDAVQDSTLWIVGLDAISPPFSHILFKVSRSLSTILSSRSFLFRLQIRGGYPLKSQKNFLFPLQPMMISTLISTSHATLCSDEPLTILLWFFCYFAIFAPLPFFTILLLSLFWEATWMEEWWAEIPLMSIDCSF